MQNNIISAVSLKDSEMSIASTAVENKRGVSLRDANPGLYRSLGLTRVHDANFAFVMTQLSKLHEKVYEPKFNTTYAQDVPIKVGGGLVDFVDFFTVEWAGMPTDANLTGNNTNIIPKVNAKLNHKKVNVYNFEIAYEIKFIEIDKLQKVNFAKSIEAIYKDAILAGWDLFCDKLAYEGANGNDGLFTSANVVTTVIPQGTNDPTATGFAQMTDAEIVSTINGILSFYLINTNNNIDLLPDTFLLPTNDATELSSRFSALYSNTLRAFLMEYNVGLDEAKAAGFDNFKLKMRGRSRLNGAGTNAAGRIVVYKMHEDYVRMDIPYPVQVYYTGPNTDKLCYTTYFVGQASEIQMPYNVNNTDLGPVTYWDFTAGND